MRQFFDNFRVVRTLWWPCLFSCNECSLWGMFCSQSVDHPFSCGEWSGIRDNFSHFISSLRRVRSDFYQSPSPSNWPRFRRSQRLQLTLTYIRELEELLIYEGCETWKTTWKTATMSAPKQILGHQKRFRLNKTSNFHCVYPWHFSPEQWSVCFPGSIVVLEKLHRLVLLSALHQHAFTELQRLGSTGISRKARSSQILAICPF